MSSMKSWQECLTLSELNFIPSQTRKELDVLDSLIRLFPEDKPPPQTMQAHHLLIKAIEDWLEEGVAEGLLKQQEKDRILRYFQYALHLVTF